MHVEWREAMSPEYRSDQTTFTGHNKSLGRPEDCPPEARAAALTVLDQVSAPLTERQLARSLRAIGIGLLDAKRMARALRKLDILAVAPRGP